MMRVAVTGSTGQLGASVAAHAAAQGDLVLGLARSAPEPCDLRDRDAVLGAVTAFRPDLVVHTAGLTDVDRCERDPEACHRANVDATAHLAEAAAAVGAHVLFLSTNHVFPGDGDRPHAEDDPVAPGSAYAASKVEGERLVGPSATVVRTSWVCASRPGNFVARIVERAAVPGELRFVDDEVARLTFVDDLAPRLLRLGLDRQPGAWHLANDGAASSFEIAQLVLEVLGEDPARVVAISADDLPLRLAPRPRNGVLSTRKADAAGYGSMPELRSAVERLVGGLVAVRARDAAHPPAMFVQPGCSGTLGGQVDQGSVG